MILTTDEKILRPWVENVTGWNLQEKPRFIGRLQEDGEPWGVVIYQNFTDHNCEMHWVGLPGWLNRTLIRHAFRYPFGQLDLARVTGLVDEELTDVIGLNKRLGFQVEGRLRNGLGDRDMIIMGMTRDECRFDWKRKT